MTNPKNEQDIIKLGKEIKKLPKEEQKKELDKWRKWFNDECKKHNCLHQFGNHIPFEREYFFIGDKKESRVKWYDD